MIIDPGFPDHWKVRELNRLSGTKEAVIWMLRLWGECQRRRSQRFESELHVARVCGFEGDPLIFIDWLSQLNWIEKNCEGYIALKWEEHNSSLIANWENGKKGGRPAKPKETHGIPMENPPITQAKPIRLDRIREDSTKKIGAIPPPPSSLDLLFSELKPIYHYLDLDVEKSKIRAWMLANPGKRKLTKKFVVNWLNRADRPLLDQNTRQNGSSL